MNDDAACPRAQHSQRLVHAMTINSSFELNSCLHFPSFTALLSSAHFSPDTQGRAGNARCG